MWRNRSHTQTHDTNNTTNDYTRNHPPHSTTIEGGAATVRTISHTRMGGRAEVSVGGKVEMPRCVVVVVIVVEVAAAVVKIGVADVVVVVVIEVV